MVKRQNRTTARNPQNNEALVMLIIVQLEAAETDLEAVSPCVRERLKRRSTSVDVVRPGPILGGLQRIDIRIIN